MAQFLSFQQAASIYSSPNVFLSLSSIALRHTKDHLFVLVLLKDLAFPTQDPSFKAI